MCEETVECLVLNQTREEVTVTIMESATEVLDDVTDEGAASDILTESRNYVSGY